MNKWDQMREAMQEAKATMCAADSFANQMAEMLQGRLRKVHPWVLQNLKRQLADFDAHRKIWKEDKQ